MGVRQRRRAISLNAPGPITIDNSQPMLSLALQGAGVVYAAEPLLAPYVARGELEFLLEDWASMGGGFFIYYSSRRQVPTGLRLLIDLIKEHRPCAG